MPSRVDAESASQEGSAEDYVAEFIGQAPLALRYDVEIDEPGEVAALLAAMVPQGARVLDVGCGTGAVSAVICRKRAAEIVGIEPNEERADRARARGLRVVQGVLTPDRLREI